MNFGQSFSSGPKKYIYIRVCISDRNTVLSRKKLVSVAVFDKVAQILKSICNICRKKGMPDEILCITFLYTFD